MVLPAESTLTDEQIIKIADHLVKDKYLPPAKRALLKDDGTKIIDATHFPVTFKANGDVVIKGNMFPIELHRFVQHVLEPYVRR